MRDEPDDAVLEEQLRQIIERLDPVPERLLAAAKDCYTWRTVDSDLAELVFDSMAEDHGVLVRGADPPRLLSFEAHDLTVDIEVSGSGSARRIIGQLAPPQRSTIQIRQGRDAAQLETDELGRFTGPLRDGPFSLLCTGAEGSLPVVTDWITI